MSKVNFTEKLNKAGKGPDNPARSSLTFLSDLSSDDRATFREMWPQFSSDRRRRIVSDLVEMAEDNLELSFRHVFLASLEDSDPQVRLSAIEGLYEDESRLLLGRLMVMLHGDKSVEVREAVASALGRFTYMAHCDKLGPQGDKLRDALLTSARDGKEEANVRRRAIEALGYFHGDADVQELIVGAYKKGGRYAESALFAMGRSMDDRWQQIVLDELQSERPAMRYEAARAAGEMTLEDGLPDLIRLVGDKDVEVRLMAVWALGQIGGKPAAQALAQLVKSNEPAMREAAQEALQELAFSADPLNVLR
jgi:HEAT repeat protein